MWGNSTFITIHKRWIAFIWAMTLSSCIYATPAEEATNRVNPTAKPTAPLITRPFWSELTHSQQQALAPLSADWDKFNVTQKRKWLEIGNKFSKITPDEQQRIQERMRDWIKLTPEQRRLARETYSRTKRLNSTQKTAHWDNYQQLPEDQKNKLANETTRKKRVANLPSSVQTVGKTVHTSKPKSSNELAYSAQKKEQSAQKTSIEPTRK